MLTVSESFSLVGLEIESMHCGNLHSSDSCFPRRATVCYSVEVGGRARMSDFTYVRVCVCLHACALISHHFYVTHL